jgi:putative thioredoxin
VLEQDQTNVKAYTGFARALLAEGRLAEVQSLMEQVPEELLAQPEIISLAGMIGLAEQAASLPDTATLQAAVDANADDHGARHTLAQALLGRGQPEAGADHLLEIMRRDREWNDDGARQALLALFDALGQSAPLTVTYRKKLSALLFS